jgi:hypothetical protein
MEDILMKIFVRNKAHHRNLPTSVISLLGNMVQIRETSGDDTALILDCVDEHLPEAESSDSDNEIRDNRESNHESGI